MTMTGRRCVYFSPPVARVFHPPYSSAVMQGNTRANDSVLIMFSERLVQFIIQSAESSFATLYRLVARSKTKLTERQDSEKESS